MRIFFFAGCAFLAACQIEDPGFRAGDVDPNVYATGLFANRIEIESGIAYVVASGDNRIEKVDLESCTLNRCTNVGNLVFSVGASPFDLSVSDSRYVYATLNLGNALGVANSEGEIVAEADVGLDDPLSVVTYGTKAFVSNGAYDFSGAIPQYGPGTITVVDISTPEAPTLLETITLPFEQPLGMVVRGRKLYVVCAGAFGADYLPVTAGGVVTVDADTHEVLSQIDMGLTAPGPTIVLRGDLAYVPSALGVHLLKVNVTQGSVLRGEADPITLSDGEGYAPWVTLGPDNRLYVPSFQEDVVYVVDPDTDTVLDAAPDVEEVTGYALDDSADLGVGPIASAFWERASEPDQLFVVNTLANNLAAITLR